MADMFFPPELPKFEYDDDLFFPKELPQIDLPEPEQKEKGLMDDVTRFGQRTVKSFAESSALMQLAGALRERFPDVPADPYSKVLQEAIEKAAPETLPVWEEIAREEWEKAQKNITESPASTSDVIADTIGSIGGTILDYATISEILGPLLGKVPAAVEPGVTLGATGLAREGIKDIAGEDKTFKDYARAGVGGFVGGQTGKYLGEGIRYLLADKAISGNVYPFIERGLTGAGVGAAMTGIDYAFGEETTVRDLGLNMASMALMYTIPMLSPKNREGINQARQAALEAQNLSKAFKEFGLKPGASKEELTQRYRSLSKTIHPDVGGSEEQFLKVNQAYDIAMEYINNSSLDPEVKTQAKNNLKDIFTKVKNYFAKPEAGLVEVERPVTQGATPAIIPVTYTRKPEVVPKSLPSGMLEEVTIGADITETQPIPETMAPETAVEETVTIPVKEAQAETQIETEPVVKTPAPEIETTPQPEVTPVPKTETDTTPVETKAEADIMSEIVKDLEGIDSDIDVIETEKYGRLEIVLDDPYQPVVVVRDEDGNTFMLERDALEEMTQAETDIEEDVDIEEDIPDWKADENYELEEKIRKIRYGGDPYYLARDMAMDEIIELENYIQERLKDERLPDYRREQYELDLMDVKRVEQNKQSQIRNVYTEEETVLEFRDEEYFEGKPLEIKTDSDGNEYMETDLDGKEIKVYVDNINQKTEVPAYIEYDPQALEMPELVKLAKDINEGKYPNIVKKRFGSQGVAIFTDDTGRIEIRADIFIGPVVETHTITNRTNGKKLFRELKNKYNQRDYKIERFSEKGQEYIRVYKKDPNYALQTLAHEIGHVIDWLPDKDIKRGNILGRLASLKKYVKHTLEDPNLGKLERNKIMDELKTLTRLWRPFDPKEASEKYVKYRYSSSELYADAVSVLFNNPKFLQQMAPTFYEAFMNYLDRKPEFKATYENILAMKKDRQLLTEELSATKRSGYEQGIEKRLEMIKNDQSVIEKGRDFLARGLLSKNHDIYKLLDEHVRNDEVAARAKSSIKELYFLAAEIEDYVYWQTRVLRKMLDNGITLNDIGEYTQAMRILTDRKNIANPEGETVQDARRTLDKLRRDLGQERFNDMVREVENFIDIRQERVVDRLVQSGMYNEGLSTHLKANRYYFKFSVLDYLDTEAAAIFPQYGTFKSIENPVLATLFTDMQLIAAINFTEAKRDVIRFLLKTFPDSIQEAESKWTDKGWRIVPPKDPNMDTLVYLVDGQLLGYYVPKEIAETFKNEPVVANTLVEIAKKMTNTVTDIMVTRNIAWAVANLPRDFQSTIFKNPEIKTTRDVLRLARKYIPALRKSWAEVMREERSPEISAMRRYRMAPADRIYQPRDITISSEVDGVIMQMLLDLGIIPPDAEGSAIKRTLKSIYDWLGDVGQVGEQASKLAGYEILTEKMDIDRAEIEESVVFKLRKEGDPVPDIEKLIRNVAVADKYELKEYIRFLREDYDDMAIKKLGDRIRERVGTPNYKEKGKWHWFTNLVSIFSNVRAQDIVSTLDAIKDDGATYFWKMLKWVVLPALAQLAIENIDKLFPESELAEDIAATMDGVSEYVKEHYLTIPVPIKRPDNKSVVITIPQEGMPLLVRQMFLNIVKREWEDIPGAIGDAVPWANVNPWLKLGFDFYNYIQGNNIYDYWRDREVISEEAMTLGGWERFKEFALYEFTQMGGSAVLSQNIKYADTTLEALLNIFPFNALGRFLRITDAGHAETINEIYRRRDYLKTQIDRYEDQRQRRMPTSITPEEYARYRMEYNRLNSLTKYIYGQRQRIQSIKDNPNYSNEEKRQRIAEIEKEIINRVRQELGKSPLE